MIKKIKKYKEPSNIINPEDYELYATFRGRQSWYPKHEQHLPSIKHLPNWFNLKEYDVLKNFDIIDWEINLTERSLYFMMIEVKYFYSTGDERYWHFWDILNQTRLSLLNRKELNKRKKKMITDLRNPSYIPSGITPLSKADIYSPYWELGQEDLCLKDGPTQKQIDEMLLNLLQGKGVTDFLRETYDPTYVKINWLLGKEQLIKDFSKYLDTIGKEKKVFKVSKKNFNVSDFNKWQKRKLLPCLDLMLWSQAHKIKIKDEIMSEALGLSVDIYRKYTKPLAKALSNYKLPLLAKVRFQSAQALRSMALKFADKF